jgi:hypothetical protein
VVAGSMTLRGGAEIGASDFPLAFLIVGIVAAFSILSFARLPADAGASMSGRGS